MIKPELNRKIYSYPLELFDRLFSWFVFYYVSIDLYHGDYELIIHVILMKFCQLLITIHCYCKCFQWEKETKAYFGENKHDYVEKLFLFYSKAKKRLSCFRKSIKWQFFYHWPAAIVEFVSECIFFI